MPLRGRHEPFPKGGRLNPSEPGDPNIVCHYGRRTSPQAFTCRDCHREFYLQCVEVKTPTELQQIVCPNCGSENLERLPPPEAAERL